MIRLRWFLAWCALTISGSAEPLSESDRQLLLERLNQIKDAAEGRTDGRIATAVNRFKAAMASNDETIELYLQCIEKLDFEDQQRSSKDFRDWKRSEKERLSNPALQLALRHQLQWLVLTLEVAAEPGKRAEMGPRAAAALAAIFGHAEDLTKEHGVLRQPVTASFFARAYNVSNLKTEGWPTVPLNLADVYGEVILPPLRRPDKIEQLRAAWVTRIQQESIVRQTWSRSNGKSGIREEEHTPAFEKFLTDERPDLLWQMEQDMFKAGDQRAAALRMLDHLERYVSHPKAAEWTTQLIGVIVPPKPTTAGNPTPAVAQP